MNGGGHLTNAATQIEGKTIDEAKEMLVEIIDELEYKKRERFRMKVIFLKDVKGKAKKRRC